MHLRSCVPFSAEHCYRLLRGALISPPCVRTSHSPSLTHFRGHTLATNIVILLASMRHRGQGITLRPTAGTPTPNGMMSNWDFLQGRSPWHVGGSNTVNISIARRARWQVVSSHPIFNLCTSVRDSFILNPPWCFSHAEPLHITREFFDLLIEYIYDGKGEVV